MDELGRFRDRREAGVRLGEALRERGLAERDDVLVLALPRGGVPVGAEVARVLGAPLDVLVVRKLGVPGQEELAMGAIAGGAVVRNEEVLRSLDIDAAELAEVVRREADELRRRERVYRGARAAVDVSEKEVVLVDDGLATGSTMRAALKCLKTQNPRALVVAVPVAAASTCAELRGEGDADACVCLMTPEPFRAVGLWYADFGQTTDDEVRELLGALRESG